MENVQLDAMRKLGMSEAEIAELMASDKSIDRGEKLFELPDELKAGAKKARQADRKPNAEPIKRERKQDTDKRALLQVIGEALCDMTDTDVTVINPERELIIMYHDRKFKVVLSAPRT